jgi:DNA-binding IclR family transcriptional regulator
MAQREQGLQQRMLEAFRQGGESGRTLREVYRQLHLPAKQARQIADDLVLAGLLVKVFIDGAEGYLLHVSRHNGRM